MDRSGNRFMGISFGRMRVAQATQHVAYESGPASCPSHSFAA